MQAVHAVIFLSAMVQAATTADEKKVVLNQVLAEEYAISLLGAVSETLTKDNMRLFNLPGFSIHVAKAGWLEPEVDANVTAAFYGLSEVAISHCAYIPPVNEFANVTIVCDLTAKHMEVFLNCTIKGDTVFGDKKKVALHTNVQARGPFELQLQGQKGLTASVAELTAPDLSLSTELTGGSLKMNKERWCHFLQCIHSKLGSILQGLFKKTYCSLLDEAASRHNLPNFWN